MRRLLHCGAGYGQHGIFYGRATAIGMGGLPAPGTQQPYPSHRGPATAKQPQLAALRAICAQIFPLHPRPVRALEVRNKAMRNSSF